MIDVYLSRMDNGAHKDTPRELRRISDFKLWLAETKGLSPHVSSDAVSRVRRASCWVDCGSGEPDDLLLLYLNRAPAFRALSPSVRSQIRRAVSLYREFQT